TRTKTARSPFRMRCALTWEAARCCGRRANEATAGECVGMSDDLAKSRILVTNDDGINAPGLDALISIANELSRDVWVVAPETNQSGTSHSLSLTRPIRSRELNERKIAIEGTPTDCVLFAARHLLLDHPPDLVLSGVNRGTNMADDITYSGTI